MIIDISQEITKCKVYPGDPSPKVRKISDMNNGDMYNLSEFSMCSHNGTHVDAPSHFIQNGKTIDEIPLEYFVGECYVSECSGNLSKDDAFKVIDKAKGCKRILLKGDVVVTKDAADVFKKANLMLLGNESQSIGPVDSPMEVHIILLGSNIILLEGINLKNVNEGKYYLCAQPLNIRGIEGSPCRAILVERNYF